MMLLSLLGMLGIYAGLHELSDSARPDIDAPEGLEEEEQAQFAFNEAFFEVRSQDPNRRALGAANVLVSVLLIVASFMLTARRVSAIWWVTQGAIANILFVVVETISSLAHIVGAQEVLMPAIRRWVAAQGQPTGDDTAMGVLVVIYVSLVVSALVRIAFLLFVLWRGRRSDVRAVLTTERS